MTPNLHLLHRITIPKTQNTRYTKPFELELSFCITSPFIALFEPQTRPHQSWNSKSQAALRYIAEQIQKKTSFKYKQTRRLSLVNFSKQKYVEVKWNWQNQSAKQGKTPFTGEATKVFYMQGRILDRSIQAYPSRPPQCNTVSPIRFQSLPFSLMKLWSDVFVEEDIDGLESPVPLAPPQIQHNTRSYRL